MEGQPKIAIIGAGNVGSASAAAIAARRIGDVYLYDTVPDLSLGKAMDINHAQVFFHTDCSVVGCNTFEELAGADLVVVTAGAPRRDGMKRSDLLEENLGAMVEVGSGIMRCCPHAVVLVVTNPVEILTRFLRDRWPHMKVWGLGCTLDTVRLRYFLAEAAKVSIDSVSAVVIGTHNDQMIPLVRHATIGGALAEHVLPTRRIQQAAEDTRHAGARIVQELKSRGSFYAAAQCIAEIADAMARDSHAVFPLSTHCEGEYGYRDTCLALPCAVGLRGVERIVEIDLDDEERRALDLCAVAMRDAAEAFRAFS
jgi:malate dehydrogenase